MSTEVEHESPFGEFDFIGNDKPVVEAKITDQTINDITDDLSRHQGDLVLSSFNNKESRGMLRAIVKDRYKDILKTEERVDYIMQEVVGMGFVERILEKYPDATDVRFNASKVTIKTNSRKFTYDDEDITENDVVRIVKRFANETGKDFTEKEPRLNTQFGYMRVNAVHKNNAPYGSTMAIRISKPKLIVTEDNFNTLADEFILDLCKLCMSAGANMILSGIPGSGKTELTKTMTGFLDFLQVIITIEDTPEGHFKELFPHLDITSWYTNNNLTESELIDEALRNDCDWLMVTETRTSAAAYALFKGFLTGAKGITSIHSASAYEIPSRYYNMIKSDLPIDKDAFYDDFYATVDLGFHQVRKWIGGKIVRFIDEIVEFTKDGQRKTIYRRWEEDGVFYSEVPNKISDDLRNRFLASHLDISVLDNTGLI